MKADGLGEVGNWKTRFVKGEGGRVIVALHDGVVGEDRAGSIIMTNGDAVKCLGFGGRA